MATENRARPIRMVFRVNEYERDIIHKRMALANTKKQSAFLRKMACDGNIICVNYSQLSNICKEIGRIGANINQIAKRVNSTSNIYKEDIAELKNRQEQLFGLLNDMGEKIL